jgi:glycerol-3-phosphate acyltransferase PlsY
VVLAYILCIVTAYLLGSVPTGFLVAKAKGVDIRKLGSGNIGATNVFRYLGKPAGVFVMLADALKGWLAVVVFTPLIGSLLAPHAGPLSREWMGILSGVAAILGHNFTCWLHFRGGKGIATSAGVLTALVPWSLLTILAVWIIVLAVSRYVSLASICASATLPFAAWSTGESLSMIGITTALTIMAIYKHKANIQRLMNGTESRFVWRKPASPGTAPGA